MEGVPRSSRTPDRGREPLRAACRTEGGMHTSVGARRRGRSLRRTRKEPCATVCASTTCATRCAALVGTRTVCMALSAPSVACYSLEHYSVTCPVPVDGRLAFKYVVICRLPTARLHGVLESSVCVLSERLHAYTNLLSSNV